MPWLILLLLALLGAPLFALIAAAAGIGFHSAGYDLTAIAVEFHRLANMPGLVAIPLFNPDAYDAGRASGRIDIEIVNIMGFWLEGMQGNDVVGYITHYPALASGSSSVSEESAFLRTVVLVR